MVILPIATLIQLLAKCYAKCGYKDGFSTVRAQINLCTVTQRVTISSSCVNCFCLNLG